MSRAAQGLMILLISIPLLIWGLQQEQQRSERRARCADIGTTYSAELDGCVPGVIQPWQP